MLRTKANSDPGGRRRRRPGLTTMIVVGLLLGIACGIFFGEYCAPLSVVGDVFVRLLQMTVLPYIVVSLIANLGRLTRPQRHRLAGVGGLVLLLLWAIALFTVFALPYTFPRREAGSFFSAAMTEPKPEVDFIEIFIPANIFTALSENHVPAVVLMCIFVGLSLAGLRQRQLLIDQLDVLAKALIRVTHFVTRLTPLGVFAITASTAGTTSLEEAGRMQAYLVTYTGGALLLTFVVLPLAVTMFTPFRYRDVWDVAKEGLITALATGKLLIVLPLLIGKTEELFARARAEEQDGGVAPAVDVLYPLAYPFPHAGKLLAMLFIPFAAWFLGNALAWWEYPGFLLSGLFAYFGGPLLATPYLLDRMQLPHDMFQLFVASGVYCGRLSDAVGAMQLVTFSILTTCAFTGKLRVRALRVAAYLVVVTALGVSLIVVTRVALDRLLPPLKGRQEVLANLQLLDEPVEAVVYREASPNPDPRLPGETLLERIRRRGVMRLGYNEDELPFAYVNVNDQLVGFDINMAHALARDLGVTIEFVRFDRHLLTEQLRDDHFDLVMSGLVGTLERAEAMQHTRPYLDVTLALVVPDHRVRQVASYESMRRLDGLRIGSVDLGGGFVERLGRMLPNAEFVQLRTNREFFESKAESGELDALLISAESGSAFTLLYPRYQVVVPDGQRVQLPLVYAVGADDREMRDFLEHWVRLRKDDGTMQEHYDHWILGRSARMPGPRWSVIRDVLGWVE